MLRKILLGLLIVIVLAGAGFVIWGSAALGPSQTALAALNSGNGVEVTTNPGISYSAWKTANTQPALF
ncbi:MAG TPA: hypothetical protein VF355_03040 [Anaerolineaceae bacterium]